MSRLGIFVIALVLLSAGVWLTGCSDDGSVFRTVQEPPVVVSVSPADGTTNVATTAPIIITFNTPMDTMSVMAHFHCSGGDEMYQWMDSLQHHGPGPGGHMIDMDHMMDWMRDIEYTGEFHWNHDMTACEFYPNSGFAAGTDYMMYLEGGVRSHGGKMMDMHHMPYDGMMTHFRTGP